MAGIIIRPRSRILHGHDWVYFSEVLKTFGAPADGDVISIKDGKDRMIGSAIYNAKSQIVARRFSRQRQDLDADFFIRRIQQAIEYRERRGVDPRLCRLVWSESDGIPGVIVDRYGDYLVLQTLTLGMDLRKPLIVDALRELCAPLGIVERNDAPVRRADGMELVSGMLYGEAPVLLGLHRRAGSKEYRICSRASYQPRCSLRDPEKRYPLRSNRNPNSTRRPNPPEFQPAELRARSLICAVRLERPRYPSLALQPRAVSTWRDFA